MAKTQFGGINTDEPDCKKIAVSICIANYNGNKTLRACLDSVLNQSFNKTIEIIVHDDASTDLSIELIRNDYPQVKLIVSKDNVGFCISNNRMVAVAKGEYILLLNNDAALRDNALLLLFQYAKETHFHGILTLPQYNQNTGELIDMGCLFDPFLNVVPNIDRNRHQVGMVMGACLWIPHELWVTLGGFPEWLGSLTEDVFLCLRAWNSGREVRTLTKSGYDHHVGHSFGGGKVEHNRLHSSYQRRSLTERNKIYVMVIFYPAPILAVVLPTLFLSLILEGLIMSLYLRSFRPWHEIYYAAIREAIRSRKLLWLERKKIRSENCLSLTKWLKFFTPIPQKLKLLWRHGFPRIS